MKVTEDLGSKPRTRMISGDKTRTPSDRLLWSCYFSSLPTVPGSPPTQGSPPCQPLALQTPLGCVCLPWASQHQAGAQGCSAPGKPHSLLSPCKARLTPQLGCTGREMVNARQSRHREPAEGGTRRDSRVSDT